MRGQRLAIILTFFKRTRSLLVLCLVFYNWELSILCFLHYGCPLTTADTVIRFRGLGSCFSKTSIRHQGLRMESKWCLPSLKLCVIMYPINRRPKIGKNCRERGRQRKEKRQKRDTEWFLFEFRIDCEISCAQRKSNLHLLLISLKAGSFFKISWRKLSWPPSPS